MIRVLVVEDNKDSLNILTNILSKISEDIKVLTATSMKEAEEILKNNTGKMNAFLLDINLDENDENNNDGIVFAKKVRTFKEYAFTPIVMITSLANLELQSYREFHCYQYILKPYEASEIEKLMKDVLFQAGASVESSIVVKKDGINYKILCKNIICITAVTRGVKLTLVSQNKQGFEEMTVPYLSIRQLMEKLPKEEFIQCHRMFVFNKNYVDNIDYVNRIIMLTNSIELEIGVTYKNEIKKQIG